jgi:hypothetical protein
MRKAFLLLPLAAALAACSALDFIKGKRAPTAEPYDVSRTSPKKSDDEPTKIFDEATRRAVLAKRFPGASSVDLVRVLQWTEDPSGACWTESPPPWEMKIEASYVAERKSLTAASLEDLKKQGWLGLYRSPNGMGFERRASFQSIDLTVDTGFTCRCITGGAAAPEELTVPLRLRFRWQGKGKMPEVSAAVERGGKKEGLPVAFAPGHLMTYEFAVVDTFPGERAGKCGGTMGLSLLSTPPMQ